MIVRVITRIERVQPEHSFESVDESFPIEFDYRFEIPETGEYCELTQRAEVLEDTGIMTLWDGERQVVIQFVHAHPAFIESTEDGPSEIELIARLTIYGQQTAGTMMFGANPDKDAFPSMKALYDSNVGGDAALLAEIRDHHDDQRTRRVCPCSLTTMCVEEYDLMRTQDIDAFLAFMRACTTYGKR